LVRVLIKELLNRFDEVLKSGIFTTNYKPR